MRVGGLHGNTILQPTPVVPRRGEGGEVAQHHQPTQQQQITTQSPGMKYNMQAEDKGGTFRPPQQQQQQVNCQPEENPQLQQRVQRKKLDPVMEENEDEDPSMLRYESRPGTDASPMVGTSKDPHRDVGEEAELQDLALIEGEEAMAKVAAPGMTHPRPGGPGNIPPGSLGKWCTEFFCNQSVM